MPPPGRQESADDARWWRRARWRPRRTQCACAGGIRSEEHTSELQSLRHLVCRLLLEKNKGGETRTRVVGTASTPRGLEGTAGFAGPRIALSRATGEWPHDVDFRGGLTPFFNDAATTEIYTLSLHDALPI